MLYFDGCISVPRRQSTTHTEGFAQEESGTTLWHSSQGTEDAAPSIVSECYKRPQTTKAFLKLSYTFPLSFFFLSPLYVLCKSLYCFFGVYMVIMIWVWCWDILRHNTTTILFKLLFSTEYQQHYHYTAKKIVPRQP